MKRLLVPYSRKVIFGWFLNVLVIAIAVAGDGKHCNIRGVQESAPSLCGVAQQGGMLYGQIIGRDVYVRGEKISRNDVFVIGLDRDEPKILELKFCKSKDCNTYTYQIEQRKYIEQNINVDDKFIKYSPDVEKRMNREAEQVKSARKGALTDTMLHFMEFSLPDNLKKHRISGVFGSRRIFNGVPKRPHNGLDFAAPTGTPIYPIARGTVILADDHYMNGKIVMVSHGHGVVSAYLHLSEISVKVGDKVDGKNIIGKVGATGRASGAHLHLGLYHGQTAIDPALFLGVN